jgi:hypothetical protein
MIPGRGILDHGPGIKLQQDSLLGSTNKAVTSCCPPPNIPDLGIPFLGDVCPGGAIGQTLSLDTSADEGLRVVAAHSPPSRPGSST